MKHFTQAEQGAIRDMQESLKAGGVKGKFIVARVMRLACCGRKRAKTLIAYVENQI